MHKTWDRATYYKCGDVGQAVLVFKDAASRDADVARARQWDGSAWASYHPDGLTPPMLDAVGRRFSRARKRARTSYAPEEIAAVEREMVEIGRREGRVAEEPVYEQGRKRVIQRRFNVGVLEAISKRKASTL